MDNILSRLMAGVTHTDESFNMTTVYGLDVTHGEPSYIVDGDYDPRDVLNIAPDLVDIAEMMVIEASNHGDFRRGRKLVRISSNI